MPLTGCCNFYKLYTLVKHSRRRGGIDPFFQCMLMPVIDGDYNPNMPPWTPWGTPHRPHPKGTTAESIAKPYMDWALEVWSAQPEEGDGAGTRG